MEKIKEGDKYRHYKNGKLYEMVGSAFHTETKEEVIVYKSLYATQEFEMNQLWVRPKKMFLEKVLHEGCYVQRFQLIREGEN